MITPPLKIAVLLSGGGRTLQNLIDLQTAGDLAVDIRAVIGSRSGIGGLDRATNASIPAHVVDRKKHADIKSFSSAIFDLCDAAGVELICLAGWLSLIEIPDRYLGRMINIHPSLLPAFGGKGMYGNHVHQAVIEHGCKVTGCTVHFVDNTYDNGPIILQRTCDVQDADDANTLARRVFDQEMIAFPQAIKLFAEKRLKIDGRRVLIL